MKKLIFQVRTRENENVSIRKGLMVIVNPDIDVCVEEYLADNVIYDFVNRPWLAEAVTVPNDQDIIDVIWYEMNADSTWSKIRVNGRKYYRSSLHKNAIMAFNFELVDEKIPENILDDDILGRLKARQEEYSNLLKNL